MGALALAAWSTVGMACLLCGVFARMARADRQAIGMVLIVFVLFPALAGLGLALNSRDRRIATSGLIWIAVVWNAILVGSFVLLTIIGLLKH